MSWVEWLDHHTPPEPEPLNVPDDDEPDDFYPLEKIRG